MVLDRDRVARRAKQIAFTPISPDPWLTQLPLLLTLPGFASPRLSTRYPTTIDQHRQPDSPERVIAQALAPTRMTYNSLTVEWHTQPSLVALAAYDLQLLTPAT